MHVAICAQPAFAAATPAAVVLGTRVPCDGLLSSLCYHDGAPLGDLGCARVVMLLEKDPEPAKVQLHRADSP